MKLLCLLTLAVAPAIHRLPGADHPQLQPHLDKYAEERRTLDGTRAKQADNLRARYLAALTAAEDVAAKANRGGALVAIEAEKKELKADLLSPVFPADLPRTLAGARREFVAGMDALEKATAARTKETNAHYLRALASLEQLAAQQQDAALAKAVAEEKARILATATPAAAPALRKNAIQNGDFSEKLPKGWRAKGHDYQGNSLPWPSDAILITEGSETFLRFRRTASVSLANLAPEQIIMVPERAKAAVVSVRMRVEGLMPGKSYHQYPGVALKAIDVAGKSPGPEWVVAKENTRWRTFTAKLGLQPGAKTLELSVGPWAAAGICDFDDIELQFE